MCEKVGIGCWVVSSSPNGKTDGSASTQRNALAIETINLGGCLTSVPYR